MKPAYLFGIIVALLILLGYFYMNNQTNPEDKMIDTSSPLTLSATCDNQSSCVYVEGRDLDITLTITNTTGSTLKYPLEFRKSTGPSIALQTSPASEEKKQLRKNPANFDLQNQYVEVPSGESISFPWVIFASELEDVFKGDATNAVAYIDFSDRIVLNDGPSVETSFSTNLKFQSKIKLKV